MGNNDKSPVPDVAREMSEEFAPGTEVTLSTGVRARLVPVPSTLLDTVQARIKDPLPPKQFVESMGRDEPNPLDPAYLDGLDEANRKRGQAVVDALLMFGVALLDGVPPCDDWLPKLRYLERKGHIDLSVYDLDDVFDLEYVYKAFVAVAQPDIRKLMLACGILREEVRAAVRSFPGQAERGADRGSQPPV